MSANRKQSKILLIYTGGTIGMVKDYHSGALKAFDFEKVVDSIPELGQLDCVIESVSFKVPIDSSNMNPAHWVTIASLIEKHYDVYDGFVVLHGSDTMSYTRINYTGPTAPPKSMQSTLRHLPHSITPSWQNPGFI